MLRAVVAGEASVDPVPLSGLKDRLRKSHPGFSEKDYGYRSFLQFTKAARTRLLRASVENVRAFLDGAPQNVVNASDLTRAP